MELDANCVFGGLLALSAFLYMVFEPDDYPPKDHPAYQETGDEGMVVLLITLVLHLIVRMGDFVDWIYQKVRIR